MEVGVGIARELIEWVVLKLVLRKNNVNQDTGLYSKGRTLALEEPVFLYEVNVQV